MKQKPLNALYICLYLPKTTTNVVSTLWIKSTTNMLLIWNSVTITLHILLYIKESNWRVVYFENIFLYVLGKCRSVSTCQYSVLASWITFDPTDKFSWIVWTWFLHATPLWCFIIFYYLKYQATCANFWGWSEARVI